MSCPRSPVLAGLMLMAFTAMAEKKTKAAPSLELLEFLGQWETDNGERIDPTELVEDLLRQLGMTDERETND